MATHPLPEPAPALYAAYVEELQEFLAISGLHYGSPQDIFAITERLHASGAFFEDMASLVRSIILREGGSMPQSELLRILAFAIGGPQMEVAPQVYRQPLRHLLNFVTGVLHRPWNLPPGSPAEVLDFPQDEPQEKVAEAAQPAEESEPAASASYAAGALSPVEEIPPGAQPMTQPVAPAEQTPSLAPLSALQFSVLPTDSRTSPAVVSAAPLMVEPGALDPGADSGGETADDVHGATDNRAGDLGSPAPVPTELAPMPEPPVPGPPPGHPPTRPPANRPIGPSNQLIGTVAAVFAILLMIVLHHYASMAPAQPPAVTQAAPSESSVPAATPVAARRTNAAAAPVSTAAPAAGDADASTPDTAPAPRRSAIEEEDGDYTAPPTYHSYIATASPVQPAPATQTDAASPAAAGPQTALASANSAPANAFLAPTSSANTVPASGASDVLADHPSYLDVSSGIMTVNLISAPMPDYPALARLAHVHGQVIVQAVVSAAGYVTAARVLSGPRLLRGAALDAVRRWRYRPYLLQGSPTDVATIVTLTFHDRR